MHAIMAQAYVPLAGIQMPVPKFPPTSPECGIFACVHSKLVNNGEDGAALSSGVV